MWTWCRGVVYAMLFIPLILQLHSSSLGQAKDERHGDRGAISKILDARQKAWNQCDVDAFLEGYCHSPELTFSGSSGIARDCDRFLGLSKKNHPHRAATSQ